MVVIFMIIAVSDHFLKDQHGKEGICVPPSIWTRTVKVGGDYVEGVLRSTVLISPAYCLEAEAPEHDYHWLKYCWSCWSGFWVEA